MTYQGSIPQGQAFDSQAPPISYPSYSQYGGAQPHPQYHSQHFIPPPPPQYGQQQSAPQGFPQPHLHDNILNSLPPPPPPPQFNAPPVQYVDPSFLQQPVSRMPTFQPIPSPPTQHAPQPPRLSQQPPPQPSPQPLQQPQQQQPPPPPRFDSSTAQQPLATNNSPRMTANRPPSDNSPRMSVNQPPSNSPRMAVSRPPSNNSPRMAASRPPSSNSPRMAANQSLSNISPRMAVSRPPSQGSPQRKSHSGAPKRSNSVASVSKSPLVSHAHLQVETLPLLVCVAEDCFSKARASVTQVGHAMDAASVNEYHKIISTGLGCLEVAMQSNKLWPRLEARIRLRYAGVLVEETLNTMEAETALTKGIAVCDKFLFAKVLFQRNHKAALISIDTNISESMTYKQVHWVYAFRFLKAAFYLQAGSTTDPHAFDNLKKITTIATQRGDKAICVMASLLEGLAHLSTVKEDAILRVQTCIAQASKFQLDSSAQLPQIGVLLLLLDLACSLHQKLPGLYSQKLSALQARMDELRSSGDWDPHTTEILLPFKKQPGSSQTISNDTAAILRQGDGEVDYIVLPAIARQQAFALAYTFHGFFALCKSSTHGRSTEIWTEALRILKDSKSIPPSSCLPEAVKQADWEMELICYLQVLIGLQAATLSDWPKVKKSIWAIKELRPHPGPLSLLCLYLRGIYEQGTASLDKALQVFEDPLFDLAANDWAKVGTNSVEFQLSVLAALNRIWIMQEPSKRDDAKTAELAELLRPLCVDSSDVEIRTAYNLVLASVQTNPAPSINQIKRHIQQSLNGAQHTTNTQCLSIALNIMRCRLFENVVGEQALKSAKACSAQAKKAGNLLWMSVADGMLAQSLEMQGAVAEAKSTKENGIRLANEAYERTQC